jgi:hypothetical protein
MAKKEFNKKFMHPTRRKLVDMVFTGEYDKNTQIAVGDIKQQIKRKVGDIWEDENGVWEQKDFGKVKRSKLTETMTEVRKYLETRLKCKNIECDVVGKYSRADKKIIAKTGYCAGCLGRKELQIKEDGLWNEYNEYIAYTNALGEGKDILQNLNQALLEVDNMHTFVEEDGSIEEWTNGKNVDEIKADIQFEIDRIKNEIELVTEKRNRVFSMLKDKNYELVKDN